VKIMLMKRQSNKSDLLDAITRAHNVSPNLDIGMILTQIMRSSAALSTRPCGTLGGPFGGYDEWCFWPRRRH
jgi:hypothetical protein